MKKIIYKMLRWAERITYKIFKEEIDKEVFEEMNKIYDKFVRYEAKRIKNEKIPSNIPSNKFKGYFKNSFYKQNDNSKNI